MCLLLSEELLVLLRSHPTLPSLPLPPISPILSPNQIPNPQKYTNPNFKGNCNNQNNTYKKTTHTPPKKKHTHSDSTLCSVLFSTMDFWTSSLPLDDEFEKLVIRMNPPRLIQQHIHFHFFIFIVMKLS
jgi:hypothetical protein